MKKISQIKNLTDSLQTKAHQPLKRGFRSIKTNHAKSLIFAIILFFANTSLAQASPTESILYRCKKGKTFQVKFQKNTAQLTLKPKQIYKLNLVPSASGAKYANGKIELYTKDEDAFLQINKKTMYDGCSSKLPDLTRPVRYNCESQIAPFPNKESMTLEQAEKLLVRRDGNLFIYHCYPLHLLTP